MANLALTIVNEILKLDYQPIMRDVLNSAVVLNHRLERDYESVQGDQVYIPLNISRNMSAASRAPGGTLPGRQTQGHTATFFSIPEVYARTRFSQRDIKASRNGKGAFVRIADYEMRHMIRDFKVVLNRMNYGDGTGILAHLNGDPGVGTTATVDVEHTGDAAGTTQTYFASRFMIPGTVVDFVASANKLVAGSERGVPRTVTAADRTVPNFTVSAAFDAAVADNDFVVVDGSHLNDQMGLLGIVDDGVATFGFVDTYNGIQRTTAANLFWRANVLRNAGVLRPVSLDLLQEMLDEVEIQGDGEVTAMITTYGIRRNILALLVADKRFVAPYEMTLDGGFRALSYNGIPIIPDKDAPKHKLFALDEPTIRFYQMSDIEWMEEDGSVLRAIPDEPAYEAVAFLYRDMASTHPRGNGRIDDLVDPTNL